MPTPEGLDSRRAALAILDQVVRRGHTIDAAAQRHQLPPPDKALAIAIAGETLRRLPELDALIDSATRQPLPDDSKARMVLRLALAQKIGLGTPDHAVVATALPLVDGGPRRLVHGVLGTLLRRGLERSESTKLPADVEERWGKAWGKDMLDAARRAILHRPMLDLSFKQEVASHDFPDATSLAPRHVRIAPVEVTALPGFDEGDWWVQDLAASLPARLVPDGACTVIDLCAAPGGKTMQLAAAGHEVTALDRSESRLKRLRANLHRTGLKATIIAADALDYAGGPFDAVLLDAPCSATGTFRRHPEILTRARPSIIAESAALQSRLLDHAATLVKPGGSLIYAVCSLEPEEGEERIRAFLAANPAFRCDPADPKVGGIGPTDEGFLRILPGMLDDVGGLDGFFIAHLVKAA